MNHSLAVYTINHPNPDRSRSPEGDSSSRLLEQGFIGMNPDRSIPDNDDAALSKNDKAEMVPLHQDFVPGDNDVICGRGKKCYAHTGNERFRQIVQSHLEQYSAASSRPEKSEILSTIVSEVRKNSPEGGFVKQDPDTGNWFEVGDFLAREKTSQAFRDALHEHYRSSKKSKHEKRRQRTKLKALSEKQTISKTSGDHFITGGAHSDQEVLLPPLSASPLVSRQQLTTLREDHPHPRAYSFSGHIQEPRLPTREAPSRALSLSSGRGGGRLFDRNEMVYGQQPYHRADSAPARYLEHDLSVEELAAFRHEERMDPTGHESWPRSFHNTTARHMFNPPASLHASAPHFHPLLPEDLAAHRNRSFPDSDAIMAEVESLHPGGIPSHMQRWSNMEMDMDVGATSAASNMSHMLAYAAAPTPMNTYSGGHGTPNLAGHYGRGAHQQQPTEAAHQRTDSSASATAIVAQLASALPPEPLTSNENPFDFEPIPLGGRKKKPRTERGESSDW